MSWARFFRRARWDDERAREIEAYIAIEIDDPALGAPFPPGYTATSPQYLSGDQRLSAFGAITAGLKVAYEFAPRWTADISLEHYEQRAAWRLGGSGSPGLDRFQADWLQIGLSHKF